MKVCDLIVLLQTLDPNARVVTHAAELGYDDVTGVEEVLLLPDHFMKPNQHWHMKKAPAVAYPGIVGSHRETVNSDEATETALVIVGRTSQNQGGQDAK